MKRLEPENMGIQATNTAAGKENLSEPDYRADMRKALSIYAFYENVYQELDSNAKEYLRRRSAEYKKTLSAIQRTIYPHVQKVCGACVTRCCRIRSKERLIYIGNNIGAFEFVDYLLVRCDTELPEPIYDNVEKNLESAYANHLERAHSIVTSFSVGEWLHPLVATSQTKEYQPCR